MKLKISNSTKVLNELININNNRAEDYQKAAEETRELDLKIIFGAMAEDSTKNSSELTRKIKQSGGSIVAQISTFAGFNYRFCKMVRTFFTGSGRQLMLNNCESGDDVAQSAYHVAVLSDQLSSDERQLVRNQQVGIDAAYDIIKKFRNGQAILS